MDSTVRYRTVQYGVQHSVLGYMKNIACTVRLHTRSMKIVFEYLVRHTPSEKTASCGVRKKWLRGGTGGTGGGPLVVHWSHGTMIIVISCLMNEQDNQVIRNIVFANSKHQLIQLLAHTHADQTA